MDMNKLISIARDAMAQRKAHPMRERGFVFHHGLRVGRLAVNLYGGITGGREGNTLVSEGGGAALLRQTQNHDLDILFAGGLFHDVAKGFARHEEVGAQLVRVLLKDECTPEEVEQIAFLVEHHNRPGPGLPIAARVVHDADALDHVGAQMVWLAFQYSANAESGPSDCARYYFSSQHERHLAHLRESLNFDLSRELFDRRRQIETRFFERFLAELDGAP